MYNTIPWDFKEKFQDCEGNLTLHSDKGYFDYLSNEFGRETIEKRLLTLARLIHFGLDLPNYVKGYKERKSDYVTSTLANTALCYIQTLRWGEAIHATSQFMLDNMSETALVTLLQEELKVRYTIWESIGQDTLKFSNWRDDMLNDMALLAKQDKVKFKNILTSADFSREYQNDARAAKEKLNLKTMTREEIITKNPWIEVANKIQECIDTKIWTCDGGFICENDREIIEMHNNRCDNSKSATKKRCRYVTDLVTSAHSGNVLDAKIVILLLNPGYSELVDRKIFERLNDETKAILYQDRIKALTFNAQKMLDSEEDCILGNAYWHERLSSLWKREGIDEDVVLTRTAILQSAGYKSTEFAALHNGEHLIGEEHVERVMQYLAEQNNCLFIIARKSDLWSNLLANNSVAHDRIIKLNSARNTAISRGNMTSKDFAKILDALKE